MRDDMRQAATNFETSVQSEISKTEGDLNAAASAAAGETPSGADHAAGSAAEPPKLTEKAG